MYVYIAERYSLVVVYMSEAFYITVLHEHRTQNTAPVTPSILISAMGSITGAATAAAATLVVVVVTTIAGFPAPVAAGALAAHRTLSPLPRSAARRVAARFPPLAACSRSHASVCCPCYR